MAHSYFYLFERLVNCFLKLLFSTIIIIGSTKVRIRRGRKFKDEEISKNMKENQMKDVNKNYLHEKGIF